MSLPSTQSSASSVTISGDGTDLSHERTLNTEPPSRDDHRAETAPSHIILDSDDDVQSIEPPTPPRGNSSEAAGRDITVVTDLPHRSATSTDSRSRNQPGPAGSTYDTAIDISLSPGSSRTDNAQQSPASLSRRISQRSSYIADEYPAPQRGPPASTTLPDVETQTQWPHDSIGRSHASGTRSTRDAPDMPGVRGGYRFPDMDSPEENVDPRSQSSASRRRPSSMLIPTRSRDPGGSLDSLMYGVSPVSPRPFSGGPPRYYSDLTGPSRRPSSELYDASRRHRSFSARNSSGESLHSSRPFDHHRYSSMSMPRWQPTPEGPSRSRRDRGSLTMQNETRRNITLDDIFQVQDINLPRWQPDAEVTSCPICGTIFSFWYRKHHCRKCGRVVCAACSPHRITIPRQYIVRPPESTTPPPGSSPSAEPTVIDLTGDETTGSNPVLNPALGGGEEVRLCNPCVPDPNPNPLGYEAIRPPGHRSTHSLSSTMGNIWPPDNRSSRQGRLTVGANDRPSGLAGVRQEVHRTSSSQTGESTTGRSHPVYPVYTPSQSTQRPSAVSERDLCPICGNCFPPIDEDHPAESREAHIRQCIDGYGANRGSPASQTSAQEAPTQCPPVARMLAFVATEKDCLGEGGNIAECTICMEDYEVGQVLSRLECLCKFHKDCIVDWFERKAECPVHKVS
ncbi:hypothetical protein PENSTE_c002G08889 [Penicillium steckii]|uniref:RING-type E3 ubiquitin transferase n=1 Tax=Penicillium steckii TaxID=303698 RepID=A0A1V6TV78_9EURO|nr:hypothetical protein PENSTE_c002G08889 [Penicillium steckii]